MNTRSLPTWNLLLDSTSTHTDKKAVKALEALDFEFRSQRGSHMKYRNAAGRTVIVPNRKELAIGTLSSIIRQSGHSIDEFLNALNNWVAVSTHQKNLPSDTPHVGVALNHYLLDTHSGTR